MRDRILAGALACAFVAAPFACVAKVRILVDLSSQTMQVDSASGSYTWPISSARDGYVTPQGHFSVQRMEAVHYSKEYYNSPMPHSIFFDGGFAIHGTYETRSLGRPVSHGCVRISPAHAATLFRLVEDEGATIDIVGDPPSESDWTLPASDDEERPVRRRAAAAPRGHYEEPETRIFGFFPFP
ncbi:L,D-transpeptidase [Rhodoblastus acidophilus]|uniref:L,D-transpeptidase n=1 Tax=Candidatus Rhodoblastus alkanivorans TaxID=2954117 RepID=A0ABS9ZB61_9HYPH|nr:L,D-transpeptidase [Candidatus Rhodoblastus alkanivorans]MCI4679338.1 L,D-transpeptidase [Candidatus Rhodoblastus alkanivorans]MCI4684814.1 L,D-transpeptidase [Candidatus Rhodoblastus alkanivorans]MDI4642138.1 L,D-transpeptidase [Rhodoblastus acidophilus]